MSSLSASGYWIVELVGDKISEVAQHAVSSKLHTSYLHQNIIYRARIVCTLSEAYRPGSVAGSCWSEIETVPVIVSVKPRLHILKL